MTKLIAIVGVMLTLSNSYAFVSEKAKEINTDTQLFKSYQTKKKSQVSTVQCKALSKSTKKRCKNKTSNSSGYCRVHGG